jgi:hypothetical protein
MRTEKTHIEIALGDESISFHPKRFDTEEEAAKVITQEYRNRNKRDGYGHYWRNIKCKIQRVTTIREVLVSETIIRSI